jgi:hypothetical protein
MKDEDAGVPGVRGYVVSRQDEPCLRKLVGDVDYQEGMTARAQRVQAVTDADPGFRSSSGDAYAALPRDQWYVLRHG